MLELYHDWRSFCSIKVRLCLAEKRLAWTSHGVDLLRLEHLRPEYLRLNPNGVVPTLLHDGSAIHESTIINEYLDEVFPEVPLVPRDSFLRARMRYWVKYEDDVLHPAIRPATLALLMGHALAALRDDQLDSLLEAHPSKQRAQQLRQAARLQVDAAHVESARDQILRALERLESQLAQTRYLGCDQFTLADVAAAPFIDRIEELRFADLFSGFSGVRRWTELIKSRPSYLLALPRNEQRFPSLAVC